MQRFCIAGRARHSRWPAWLGRPSNLESSANPTVSKRLPTTIFLYSFFSLVLIFFLFFFCFFDIQLYLIPFSSFFSINIFIIHIFLLSVTVRIAFLRFYSLIFVINCPIVAKKLVIKSSFHRNNHNRYSCRIIPQQII